jgi:hypothetical protein
MRGELAVKALRAPHFHAFSACACARAAQHQLPIAPAVNACPIQPD